MDFISHILIGKIISFNKNRATQIWTMVFSFLPDLSQLPYFLILGYQNARPFLLPNISDWSGARQANSILTSLWEIQHSLFFAFFIILPIVLFFKLPKIAFFGYALHIIIDIPTHAGEWAIKPFYPIKYAINGFTDAWAWSAWLLLLSWIILIFIIFFLNFYQRKIKNDKPVN